MPISPAYSSGSDHVNKNLDKKKGPQTKKTTTKSRPVQESSPEPPLCEASIVTTVLRGSQLPTSLSFYLKYIVQEETKNI